MANGTIDPNLLKTQLKEKADASFNIRLHRSNEILKGYAVQKLSNTTDQIYQQNLDKQIQDESLNRDSLMQQYPQDMKFLDSNPEAYKGELYKQTWMSNMTQQYAYANTSLTYEKSPYFEAYMDRLKDSRDAEHLRIDWARLAIEQEDAETKRAAALKAAKVKDPNAPGFTDDLGAPVTGDIGAANVTNVTAATFQKETNDQMAALKGERMNLAANLFQKQDLVRSTRALGQDSPTLAYKDAASEAYGETGIDKLYDAYKHGDRSMAPVAIEFFKRNAAVMHSVESRNAAAADVLNEVNSRTIDPDSVYSKIGGLNIEANGLPRTHVSASDIGAFSRKLDNEVRTYNTPISVGGPSIAAPSYLDDAKANIQFSTPVEKMMYNVVKKAERGEPLTKGQQPIMDKINEARGLSIKNHTLLDVRDRELNNRTKDLVQADIPASFPILPRPGDDGTMNIRSLVHNLLNNSQKKGAGTLVGGSTMENFGKVLSNKNATYNFDVLGGNQHAVRVSAPEAGVPDQSISLNAQQVEDNFPGSNIKTLAAVHQDLALTHLLATPTTDVKHTGEASSYPLENENLKNYAVTYHIEEPNRDGRYQARAYITNKSTGAKAYEGVVPLGTLMTGDQQLSNFLSNFGDQWIEQLLAAPKAAPKK